MKQESPCFNYGECQPTRKILDFAHISVLGENLSLREGAGFSPLPVDPIEIDGYTVRRPADGKELFWDAMTLAYVPGRIIGQGKETLLIRKTSDPDTPYAAIILCWNYFVVIGPDEAVEWAEGHRDEIQQHFSKPMITSIT